MAVSNMAFVNALESGATGTSKEETFWRSLGRTTSEILRLQLAVFPDSSFHYDETIVAARSDEIKRMYEAVAGGVSFRHASFIQSCQLGEAAKLWNEGLPIRGMDLSSEKVVEGSLSGWKDTYSIGLELALPEGYIDGIRRGRDRAGEALEDLVSRWSETDGDFWERFDHEVRTYGEVILYAFVENAQRWQKILAGRYPASLPDLPNSLVDLFRAVERTLGGNDTSTPTSIEEVRNFLMSEALREVPFVRISSLLYAGLARKVAAGQRRVTRGVVNDFNMIGTLLPYCDAMFIDRECHGLLDEEPIRSEVERFNVRLFSMRNREDFLGFLEQLVAASSSAHRALVDELFGKELQR